MNSLVIGPVRSSRPTWMKRAPDASPVTAVPQRGPRSATSFKYDSGK
jgi:hypothetical protein